MSERHTNSGSQENGTLGDLGTRAMMFLGVPGAFVLALGAFMTWQSHLTWERFLRGYLVAFVFVLSLSLGGLFFTMLQHLTRAGWSVVVRRLAEGLAANLRWLWIFFIPIVIGLFKTDLYHWVHPGSDAALLHKEPFLNPAFWLIRAVFYFAVWGGLAHFFLRSSIAQDATGDPRITLRMETVAAPGMILYAFTQTFAIIDWVMTIEPHWFSTMFGVYYFAASCCGFGSTLVLLAWSLQRSGRLTEVTTEHYHDLGKFVFAFGIVFWAYIAYSQYMLIWYANIQEETIWYVIRQLGGWKALSILLLVGHFVIPYFLLMTRITKRRKGVLAAICAGVLVIHYLDMYWLAMPDVPAELIASVETLPGLVAAFETGLVPGTDETWQQVYGLHFHIVDACCLLGLGGIYVAMTARGLRGASLVPAGDPRLDESLAFENF